MKLMRLEEITQEMSMNEKKQSGLNPGMLQGWEGEEGPAQMIEKEQSIMLGENQDQEVFWIIIEKKKKGSVLEVK